MKKILFVMFAFIALTFVACNSQVKSDIQNYEERVENVSFKEIEIGNNFYEYTNDYTSNVDLYCDKVKKLGNAYEIARMCADAVYDGINVNYYKSEQESALGRIDTYKYELDSLKLLIDNISMTTKQGTLYVAKMKEFNKFGKKNDFYSFKVYAYNKDGSIHEYDGKDKMELVLTAYPDAMKEVGKALKQAFGV